MAGRPTLHTPELADAICARLATGESLRAICRGEEMPHESTVRLWAMENRAGFSTHYARARDLGLEAMADELLEIADDGTNDWIERRNAEGEPTGQYTVNGEVVNRSRLRVDTRKWLLSKIAPKRYGDRLEHVGPNGGPIQTEDLTHLTPVERAQRAAALLIASAVSGVGQADSSGHPGEPVASADRPGGAE